jgi:hypothetical protein
MDTEYIECEICDTMVRFVNYTAHVNQCLLMERRDFQQEMEYEMFSHLADTIGNVEIGVENIDHVIDELDEPNEFCPVCLECKDTVKIRSCKHNFCKACITQWLSKSKKCPTCMQEVVSYDPVPSDWHVKV